MGYPLTRSPFHIRGFSVAPHLRGGMMKRGLCLLFCLLVLFILTLQLQPVQAADPTCGLEYYLPGDIPVSTSEADPSTFQEFAWQSFLALNAPGVGAQISTSSDNVTQWSAWSSTVDLLLCQETPAPEGCVCPGNDCTQPGTRYYPTACRGIPSYQSYRVLYQVGKVDDSFLEASAGGLSDDPVIDRFGNFLRYEILLSPATYDEVIQEQLFDEDQLKARTSDVSLGCGVFSYKGGDPANPMSGALVMKVAWMDVEDELGGGNFEPSKYHLEKLLVYTPSYRNSTGEETCELRTMAMVGMHFERKTENQPNWIWATFEQNDNAPDCTGPMPGIGSQEPNTSCPDTVSTDYNLYPMDCNSGAGDCAPCNTAPASNAPPDACVNPKSTTGNGWCLDLPANPTNGRSKLCRQVPVADYPEAGPWNDACQAALGASSVWANYGIISSQWCTSAIPAGCDNVAALIAGDSLSGPIMDVILPTDMTPLNKPFLGNTTMESYDRSNCTGCHAKARITNNAGNTLSTDLMYWLQLEVAEATNNVSGYSLDYLGNTPGSQGETVASFRFTRSALDQVTGGQVFDFIFGARLPDCAPMPTVHILQHNASNLPPQLDFVPEACTGGNCPVDRLFPPSPGHRWFQYRSSTPISFDPGLTQFAGTLTLTFPAGTCDTLYGSPMRVWFTDNTERLYGDVVDGALLSGVLNNVMEPIPGIGPFGLAVLGVLLLFAGIWWQRRRRASADDA